MTRARLLLAVAVLVLAACRDEAHRAPPKAVEPPVDSVTAIPDAPVNGTLHGTQFVLRDARVIVDRRLGYVHTDIKLSAGKAESPCGPTSPAHAPSVWLRLEGDTITGAKDLRLAPGSPGPWSVHYQVFEGERWFGVVRGAELPAEHRPTGPRRTPRRGHTARLPPADARCGREDLPTLIRR